MRKCCDCNKLKDEIEFHSGTRRCKPCARLSINKYNRLKLGVTVEEYNEYLLKQECKCAICKRPAEELNKQLCVDHDHLTGKVRGLLCYNCNLVLGNAKDSVEVLGKAIEYLSRP